MIYSKQLKDILTNVRFGIESGDTKAALAQLEMVEMYADYHQFNDPRIAPAIQYTAKGLGLTEPEAIEELLFLGFFEAGRVAAGGGFSLLRQMMSQRKLETIQMMMPYFGVVKMSASEESAELSRILKDKRG